MRNGYIVDTLTSVDIQEIAKLVGKIPKVYGGVVYGEIFKTSIFKKLFEFSQN